MPLAARRPLAALALLAASLALQACSTNPTTGRRQFNALSREQEIQIGADNAPALTQEFGGEVQNAELQAYVTEIGAKLAAVTEADNPQLPWEFTLLNSDVINAFALPGGKVFVSRGLVEKMTNEAQLAAVLGHEVGHVTARHSNDRMVQQGLGTLIGVGVGIAAGEVADNDTVRQVGPAAGAGIANVVVLSYSRNQEIEADTLGMRYMARVGYDPVGALQLMQILQRESGERGGLEFLQTHPYPETRIDVIRQKLQTEYANTQGNPQFQTHEDRFRQRFLSKLATLPRPSKDDERAALALLASAEHDAARCAAHCTHR